MIREVRLPEISENVEEGDVTNVLVSVGDVVKTDQPLVELETEKAVLEVPSPFEGTVTEILVKVGDTVKVNQVMMKIDTARAAVPAEEDRQEEVDERAGGAGREATREEIPASAAEDAREEPQPSEEPGPAEGKGDIHRETVPASPSVRRLARELGVEIRKVPGSGPGGRISKEDIKTYAKTVVREAGRPGPRAAHGDGGGEQREPMSKVRRITATRMREAWTTVPHVTQYDKADITELEALRLKYMPKVEEAGGKLTMTSILLKFAASALKAFPRFNASIDENANEIVYKKYYHLGVAVDTDRGLLVPVVRDVDKKNITELSVELADLAERARNKKITPEEMEGGTFTISNLGGIGGTAFSPIVYPPQVAILGVSRGRMEPVFRDGDFEPRFVLPLSLSYDHRVIDGADGARFLRWLVEALEKPILLALEG